MFTQNTPESKAALHSFLEAATESKIASVVLKPNDANIFFGGQRRISYDILCALDNGQSVNIEMQAFNQSYDYGARAEHQVSRLEVSGLKKGDSWQKAPKVYQISVLNFRYKKAAENDDDGIKHYFMQTTRGEKLAGLLNVIFIELPLIEKKEATIAENTALENWAIFLKEADNPKKQDLIKKLTEKEAGLMNAQASLAAISEDRDLWLEQYRYEVFERDRQSSIEAGEEKGFKIGFEKGLADGMQQGIEQGRQQGIEQGRQQGIEQGRQQGIEQGRQQGIEQGRQQGIEQGRQQGIEQGRQQGIEQGENKKALSLARKYMQAGHSAKEAAEFAEIDIKLLE